MDISCTVESPDALVAASVRRGAHVSPVWIQSRWEEGEFATYIQKNGCGHCCVAMAARLLGTSDVTPYTEYEHCRALFGPPDKARDEGHFLSPRGVALSLRGFGLRAEVHPYAGGRQAILAGIMAALFEGRLVVFLSFPDRPGNRFSTGAHYVLLYGINAEGRIMVANSSTRAVTDTLGLQAVTEGELLDAIPEATSVVGEGDTWGREHGFRQNAGYVTVSAMNEENGYV